MVNPIHLKILKKHCSLLKTNNMKKAPSLRNGAFLNEMIYANNAFIPSNAK